MYTLNQTAIAANLFGNDPLEPNAIMIHTDVDNGTSSRHKIVYLVIHRGDIVGQGLSDYGRSWDSILDFYTQAYAPNGVSMEVGLDAITPKQRGIFIQLSQEYLRSCSALGLDGSHEPFLDGQKTQADIDLANGVCQSPEAFSRHVQILAKDMTDFRFKYDHLAMFAALSLRIEQVSNDLDLVKKASIYEDETRLNGCSELFKSLMSDIFATDDAHGGGKSLVHPDALQTLDSSQSTRDLVHMLVGIIGEAGELAQALHNFLVKGQFVMQGKDSLPEELGDLRFYVAGALKFMGQTEAENNQLNYDKLKTRYPDGYSNSAALNRDLEAEARALTKE